MNQSVSLGQLVTLACNLECSIPKVGNVHRGADFESTTLYDFLVSGSVFGNMIDSEKSASLGKIILESVKATKRAVGQNTNLGIILLIAPLVNAHRGRPDQRLSSAVVANVLKQATVDDTTLVFEAIRLAAAGGLGEVEENNVNDREYPQIDLLTAMQQASNRDLIARQFANGFADLFELVIPAIDRKLADGKGLPVAVHGAHIEILARLGDTLILRKCGQRAFDHAQMLAKKCVDAIRRSESEFVFAAGELDFWLRSDSNRRNPGSTADLIAAALFVKLVNDGIESLGPLS
ncbi:MAG: triphosphoribosyl-dephospho-CoA synthase [Pirellulaceae bacterium]